MPSAYLVYNPSSGRYPSWMLVERAANILEKRGWNLTIEHTRTGAEITDLAYRAAGEKKDAFFVVGGDGSINLALPGLVGSDTALGVLPAGTANVWAQELGLPGLSWTRLLALEESAVRLSDAVVRQVDVGLCNQIPFLLWAGVGLDGFVVHRLEPRTRWEKHFAFVHYAASAVLSASYWSGMNLRVNVEGQEISGHFLLAILSNIHLYAGGLSVLSPDARLDDGVMELWLLKGETLADTVQRAIDLLSGRHLNSDQVLSFKFRSLHISSESTTYIQVDGEPVIAGGPVEVKVLSKALNILTPEKTPRMLFVDDPKKNSHGPA